MTADHPPWLRFQAYLVGLPKTGSTSLAHALSSYRTRHEWQMPRLLALGADLKDGLIDVDEFAAAAGDRLWRPTLEFDDATCHHLYAHVLVDRLPGVRFVHTVRDPLSWTNSLIDMALRQQPLLLADGGDVQSVMRVFTGTAWNMSLETCTDPTPVVAELLTTWAEHLRRLTAILPTGRTLLLRTDTLSGSRDRLAAFLAIPGASVLPPRPRNQAPARIDHVAACDRATIRPVYDAVVRPLVDHHFADRADALSAAIDATGDRAAYETAWPRYRALAGGWVDGALARNRPT